MAKIDDSYMEKLKEVLYDEKRPINYKGLSMLVGVHVNISKQMLYHFYTTEKRKGKQVFATYFISGLVPRRVIVNRENAPDTTAYSDNEQAFLVSLCKEKDMEDLKAKFTRILSVHIYSISTFAADNYDELETLAEQPLPSNKDMRTLIEFGPIMCSASQNLVKNAHVVSAGVNETTIRRPIGTKEKLKPEIKSDSKERPETKKCDDEVISQSQTSQKKTFKAPAGEKSDRLKSMFAKAATKPKPKIDQKDESTKPTVTTSTQNSNSTKSKVPPSSKSKESHNDSRKRKRIRDVLSSDSEDGEQKSDDDEVETLSESPIPRKRIQIDSDSDEEETKSATQQVQPAAKGAPPPGRRRVSKTVSKSFVDKDGFLVTTKEQVMESEEDEPNETNEKKDDSHNEDDKSGTVSTSHSSKSTALAPPVKNGKLKPPTAAAKTKQASLMSFFQKK